MSHCHCKASETAPWETLTVADAYLRHISWRLRPLVASTRIPCDVNLNSKCSFVDFANKICMDSNKGNVRESKWVIMEILPLLTEEKIREYSGVYMDFNW